MAINVREILKSFLDWRRPGGALSAAGHAAILVAGVYAFSSAQPFQQATESVPVDIVSERDFNEMMKGDKTSKEKAAEPIRRVDRVAETKEDKDPGLEKKDVPAVPSKQEVKSEPEPKSEPKLAAITPPVRPPELRVAPPTPTPPAKVEEEEDEIDEKAELLRKKKIEDQKKADEAAKAAAAAEAKRKLDEKLKADAQAKAAEDKKKLDETLKAEADAEKRAEDKRKADEKKKADAEKKARDDKAKKEQAAKEAAEAEKLNDAIRNRLNASRETPSSTGSTGAVVASRSTVGTATATGAKLSPGQLNQLGGILKEQMERCLSVPPGVNPSVKPIAVIYFNRDGSLAGAPILQNNSSDPAFRTLAEAGVRALRQCQPYKIPERFMSAFDQWKVSTIFISPPDN